MAICVHFLFCSHVSLLHFNTQMVNNVSACTQTDGAESVSEHLLLEGSPWGQKHSDIWCWNRGRCLTSYLRWQKSSLKYYSWCLMRRYPSFCNYTWYPKRPVLKCGRQYSHRECRGAFAAPPGGSRVPSIGHRSDTVLLPFELCISRCLTWKASEIDLVLLYLCGREFSYLTCFK